MKSNIPDAKIRLCLTVAEVEGLIDLIDSLPSESKTVEDSALQRKLAIAKSKVIQRECAK